jgi:hypothetical protein
MLGTTATSIDNAITNAAGTFTYVCNTIGNSNYYGNSLTVTWLGSTTTTTATTTTTTTTTSTIPTISTTSVPQEIQNQTNLLIYVSTSIAGILSLFIVVVPFAALILVILVVGIIYARSYRPDAALLSGFLISLIIYLLAPKLISVALAVFLLTVTFIALGYNIFTKRKKAHKEED